METDDYVFDFTHQDSEPVPLLPHPVPEHPPTILRHGGEHLLTARYGQLLAD